MLCRCEERVLIVIAHKKKALLWFQRPFVRCTLPSFSSSCFYTPWLFLWASGSNECLALKSGSINPDEFLKLSWQHQANLRAASWHNCIIDPFCFVKALCALESLLKCFRCGEESKAQENKLSYIVCSKWHKILKHGSWLNYWAKQSKMSWAS